MFSTFKTPTMPDIKTLKAAAHHLSPVVMLGQKGLTEAVLAEIESALDHHALIKIKIAAPRQDRATIIEAIVAQTDATLVQTIGQTAALYRKKPNSEAEGSA